MVNKDYGVTHNNLCQEPDLRIICLEGVGNNRLASSDSLGTHVDVVLGMPDAPSCNANRSQCFPHLCSQVDWACINMAENVLV